MSTTPRRAVSIFLRDIKHAFRSLRKAPAFTLSAVATLGLGIGANSAVFTVVEAVVFKGLPYRDADRLVHIWETQARQPFRQVSYPDFLDVRDGAKELGEVAGYAFDSFVLKTGEGSERVSAGRVSANFLEVLGVEAALGRAFRADEDQPMLKRGAVLVSNGLWQRRFGGDPSVVGRSITLSDEAFTVIGVLPREFHFARLGDPDVLVTLSPSKNAVERRFMHWMWAVGRLRHGATFDQANAELSAIAATRARADQQWHKDTGLRVVPLRDALVGSIRPVVLGLFGAVTAVLLIACANVANMLLARAMSRRREIGIRLALGAGRGRIVGEFLAESLLLAVAGGLSGLLWAGWGVRTLIAAIPANLAQSLPFLKGLEVDPAVLGFTFAVCLATGVLFGLVPALRASSGRVVESLRDGERGSTGRQRLRSALVVAEVAITLSLVAATGLLARSLTRLLDVDPGFRTANLVTARVAVPGGRYDTPEKITAFFDRWQARVAALPGVFGVALVDRLPLLGSGNTGTPTVSGQTAADGAAPDAELRTVSEDYFRVVGLSLAAGRVFSAADRMDAPRVAVVNRKFVEEVFKGRDSIGQRVTFPFVEGPLEVVGVVSDEKVGDLDGRVRPVLYFPWRQDSGTATSVVARVSGDPRSLVAVLGPESRAMEPDAIVVAVRTMDDLIAAVPAMFLRRYPLMILGVFAALALVLASIGIYGVVSLSVQERTSEIGIRMTLGAQTGGILGLVFRRGLSLAVLGVGAGVAAGLAGARVLSSALFETPPTDPVVFAAASVILLVVAALAIWIPARRASRLNPLAAIRHE